VVRAKATDLQRERESLEGGRNSAEFIKTHMDALQRMQTLLPRRTVVFTLDPQRSYGVLDRNDFTPDGHCILRVECERWSYFERGSIWLPKKCVESYFTDRFSLTQFSDKPRLQIILELETIEFGSPTNARFALDYNRPGSVVIDRTTPEARQRKRHEVAYTVSANGNLLRDAANVALRDVSRGRVLFWFVLANLMIFAVFTTAKMRIIRRNRRAS